MLCNIVFGVVILVFSLVLCFVLVWYMWVLVGIGLVGVIVMFVLCFYDCDVDYYVFVVEVKCIEEVYFV